MRTPFYKTDMGKMKEKIVLRCAAPSDILKALTRLENSSEAASSLLSSSPSSHSVRARTPAGTCPHSSNRPQRRSTPDCRATGGHTETPAVSVDRGEHLRKFAVCRYSDKTTASVKEAWCGFHKFTCNLCLWKLLRSYGRHFSILFLYKNVKSKHLSPGKGHLDKAMSRGFVWCVCDNAVNQSLFICAEKQRVLKPWEFLMV